MTASISEYLLELIKKVRIKQHDYPQWCAGLTSQPEDCLVNEHHVDPRGGDYAYVETDSAETARTMVMALQAMGFGTNADTADVLATFVYIYKKGTDVLLKT
jgi:hypothetical protein